MSIEYISKFEYRFRMSIIVISFIMPIICILSHGYEKSLSAYWNTELQPIFISGNLLTSYYFLRLKKWYLPAIFLVLLTAFSIEHYELLHNIFAISFFLMTLRSLYISNNYRYLVWIYLSLIILLPFSLLLYEMVSIFVICLYHGLVLNKYYWITSGSSSDYYVKDTKK